MKLRLKKLNFTNFINYLNSNVSERQTKRKSPPLSVAAPIIFAAVFVMMFTYSKLEPRVEEVDLKYVIANRSKPEFILLDVRSEAIFNGRAPFAGMKMPPIEGLPGGHIPGSVNFPIRNLNAATAFEDLERIGITRDTTLILYCNSGGLSSKFGDTLIRRFNYSPSKLKHYGGGVSDWIKDEDNVMMPEDHDPPYYSDDYWMNYAENYSGNSGGK